MRDPTLTKNELANRLREAMARYALMSYSEAAELKVSLPFSHGSPGSDDFYQGDVRFLQAGQSDGDRWVELVIAVSDGTPSEGWLGRLLGAVTPQTGSLLFHEDGRVEQLMRRVDQD